MKVYTEVVIDMKSMETISEDSYEYEGPIAHAGGGGSSGEVIYPEYMVDTHTNWLTDYTDSWLHSITPHNPLNVTNPNSRINSITASSKILDPILGAIHNTGNYSFVREDTLIMADDVIGDDVIDDMTKAYSDILDDELEHVTLPRFKAGMRDINAVQSSSFVCGTAYLEGVKLKAVAAFDADNRYKAKVNYKLDVIKLWQNAISLETNALQMKLNAVNMSASLRIEGERIGIVAEREYNMLVISEMHESARWTYDNFTYAGNLLASIGSASVQTGLGSNSTTASAIGGALSGAATGATIGSSAGPYGAAIGGVVGAAAGLISSL